MKGKLTPLVSTLILALYTSAGAQTPADPDPASDEITGAEDSSASAQAPAAPAEPAAPAAPAEPAAPAAPAEPAAPAAPPAAPGPAAEELEQVLQEGRQATGATVLKAAPASAGPALGEDQSSAAAAPSVSATTDQAGQTARAGDFSDKLGAARPYGALVVFDNAVGVGSFVKDWGARNAYIASALTLMPYYVFELQGHKLKLQARWDLEWEYTRPDNSSGRYVTPRNLLVSVGDRALYELAGLTFSASASTYLPSSYEGFASTLIAAPGLGVGARYGLAGFEFSYGLSARYFISAKGVANVPDDARVRLRAGEDAALGPANKVGRVINDFTVTYSPPWAAGIPLLEDMSATLDLMVINDFNYDIVPGGDPFQSPFAKDGMGRSDLFWTTIEVGYNLRDDLSLTAGLTALHKTQYDDGRFIVPLFGAMNSLAADNAATWYVDLTYMY